MVVAELPDLGDGRRAGGPRPVDGPWRRAPARHERDAFEAPILEAYEREGSPYFATARLWDDGVIDPLDTRRVLTMGIESRPPRSDPRDALRCLPDVTERPGRAQGRPSGRPRDSPAPDDEDPDRRRQDDQRGGSRRVGHPGADHRAGKGGALIEPAEHRPGHERPDRDRGDGRSGRADRQGDPDGHRVDPRSERGRRETGAEQRDACQASETGDRDRADRRSGRFDGRDERGRQEPDRREHRRGKDGAPPSDTDGRESASAGVRPPVRIERTHGSCLQPREDPLGITVRWEDRVEDVLDPGVADHERVASMEGQALVDECRDGKIGGQRLELVHAHGREPSRADR